MPLRPPGGARGEDAAVTAVSRRGGGGPAVFVTGTVAVGLVEGCYKYENDPFAPVGRVTVLPD